MATTNSIIQHINKIREARNWTNYQLAKESGISHSTLHALLNSNTNPSTNILLKITAAFDMTMTEFFAGLEPANSEKENIMQMWDQLSRKDKDLVSAYMSGLLHKAAPIKGDDKD